MHKFFHQDIPIDGTAYNTWICKSVSTSPEVPRLVVVSYLPTRESVKLIKVLVRSIWKFTTVPYELWIIDNNSPKHNLIWLLRHKNKYNLVLNRTNPIETGSYANGVALEIARRLVDKDTQYFMTFHQDTIVCHECWLQFLLSKFSPSIRAVGVRKDATRIPSGILHVLGYMVDFQLVQKYGLSFMPILPGYDVGDKLIVDIQGLGYDIFACHNTQWEPELVSTIPNENPFKNVRCDKAFDDDGDVIFMHLGRGSLKAKKSTDLSIHGLSVSEWYSYINMYYLRRGGR